MYSSSSAQVLVTDLLEAVTDNVEMRLEFWQVDPGEGPLQTEVMV